jgi:hypothetical protein
MSVMCLALTLLVAILLQSMLLVLMLFTGILKTMLLTIMFLSSMQLLFILPLNVALLIMLFMALVDSVSVPDDKTVVDRYVAGIAGFDNHVARYDDFDRKVADIHGSADRTAAKVAVVDPIVGYAGSGGSGRVVCTGGSGGGRRYESLSG